MVQDEIHSPLMSFSLFGVTEFLTVNPLDLFCFMIKYNLILFTLRIITPRRGSLVDSTVIVKDRVNNRGERPPLPDLQGW